MDARVRGDSQVTLSASPTDGPFWGRNAVVPPTVSGRLPPKPPPWWGARAALGGVIRVTPPTPPAAPGLRGIVRAEKVYGIGPIGSWDGGGSRVAGLRHSPWLRARLQRKGLTWMCVTIRRTILHRRTIPLREMISRLHIIALGAMSGRFTPWSTTLARRIPRHV